ncbi:MAG: HAD-IA family hydrolase [Deltaproteobacteria bacterium]|nr:HAD-IA family hydrolase [Deltaproteobacteria bacterium]
MARIEMVIYDLDGVLVYSRDANAAFYNHLLAHFGRPALTPEQLEAVQALTARQAVDLLFAGDPRREEAQVFQLTVDNTPFLPLLRLEPHVRETLGRLRSGRRTAIATNRGKSLPLVLAHLEVAGLFDLTVSSLEVSRPKPHPRCLHLILERFGITPRQAVYLGDAQVDRETAHRAGVPFGAYKNPGLAADFHLDDHRGIFDILEGMA